MKLVQEIEDEKKKSRELVLKYGQVIAALKATPEWAAFEQIEAEHIRDLERKESSFNINHPYYERVKAYLSGHIAGLRKWRTKRDEYLEAYALSISKPSVKPQGVK